MTYLTKLCLTLTLFMNTTSALAQTFNPSPGTPVEDKQLIFRGQGIRNPKTDEVLFLVCKDGADPCNYVQYVLYKKDGSLWWWSAVFTVGSQKEFKKKMKNLNWASKKPEDGLHKTSEVVGTIMVFGAAGTGAVLASTGVGVVAFGVAVFIVAKSKRHWKTFDVLTLAPRAISNVNNEKTLKMTIDRDGWNWASKSVRMRPVKFLRLKKILRYPEIYNIESGTLHMGFDVIRYLYEEGDVEFDRY